MKGREDYFDIHNFCTKQIIKNDEQIIRRPPPLEVCGGGQRIICLARGIHVERVREERFNTRPSAIPAFHQVFVGNDLRDDLWLFRISEIAKHVQLCGRLVSAKIGTIRQPVVSDERVLLLFVLLYDFIQLKRIAFHASLG